MDIRHNVPISDLCAAGGEEGECSMAEFIVPKCRNVLEIGAGAEGNVSRAIQRSLNEPSRHLAVELDAGAYESHRNMMKKYDLKHTLVHGSASALSLKDVKAVLGGDVHCVVADCEACLVDFFKGDVGKEVLKTVEIISNEMDGEPLGNAAHDHELRNMWASSGLCPTTKGFGCRKDCDTEMWQRSTCQNVREKCKSKTQEWGCSSLVP